jgi:tetratricopeptide (TPR) repeat protein
MAETLPGNLSKQEIERMVQEASAALMKGDLTAAHAIADGAIAAGAEDPFLLKVKALWLHNEGQYQEALRSFHYARTLTPDDPSILDGIAGCLAGMGAYDAALKMVDASLELAPDAPPTHFLRGWIHETSGNLPMARECYERTLSLDPRHVEAMAGLASVAVSLNDLVTARALAAQALAIDPRQSTATIALAKAELAQGKPVAAEGRMRNLLQINSSARVRLLALGVLADALDVQGRKTEALAVRNTRDAELARGAAPALKPTEPMH